MTHESIDCLLVGAGPIGLELAVNLHASGVEYIHLDAQQIGHTISWFPRQAHFFSSPERIAIAGVPLMTWDQGKATREEYLNYLLAIVRQFKLSVRTYERVTHLRHEPAQGTYPWTVASETAGETRNYRARRVILATGDMHHPRQLAHPGWTSVPGADAEHVSHYFVEPHAYAFRDLLIVGGKNSAIEAALRCHRIGARVALCQRGTEIHPSIKYWLKPEIESLIERGEIAFYPGCVPIDIGRKLTTLAPVDHAMRPSVDRSTWRTVPADFVLLLIGYEADSHLLAEAGVRLRGTEGTPTLNLETMETNVPGLFMAGTAVAGTQRDYRLFIENSHAHVVRIIRAITGGDPQFINPLGLSSAPSKPLPAES